MANCLARHATRRVSDPARAINYGLKPSLVRSAFDSCRTGLFEGSQRLWGPAADAREDRLDPVPQTLDVAPPFEQGTRAAATALPMQIAMLIHGDMLLVDLVGPSFSRSQRPPCTRVEDRDAVVTSTGFADRTNCGLFRLSRGLHVLFVPGGLKGSLRHERRTRWHTGGGLARR